MKRRLQVILEEILLKYLGPFKKNPEPAKKKDSKVVHFNNTLAKQHIEIADECKKTTTKGKRSVKKKKQLQLNQNPRKPGKYFKRSIDIRRKKVLEKTKES